MAEVQESEQQNNTIQETRIPGGKEQVAEMREPRTQDVGKLSITDLQEKLVQDFEMKEFDKQDSEAQVPEKKPVPTKTITEEYVLVNAYDELVRTNVRSLMVKMDMCQCEKCYLDACALVFNRRYTHFVTTHRGALLTKVPEMSRSNQVEMTVVILEALRMVKSFPKH